MITLQNQPKASDALYSAYAAQYPGHSVVQHLENGTVILEKNPLSDSDIEAVISLLKKKGLISESELKTEKDAL